MTEQEQVEAVDALCSLLHWKLKDKPWQACNAQEKEALRHATTQTLRTLHSENALDAQKVCESLAHERWMDATEQDKLTYAYAVAAMKEAIESEL